MLPRRSATAGFTLLELIIVITIIGVIIIMAGILALPRFIQRARDTTRKKDLEEYRIQLEAYNNDHKEFPPVTIMDSRDDCNSGNLRPYMARIFCDPQTKEPYVYRLSQDGRHYWIYTKLTDASDPAIFEIGCGSGCGPDEDGDGVRDYNYGVSNTTLDGQEIGVQDPGSYCQCTPGVCGTCCPGSKYRCNVNATGCYYDATCQ